jgi:hypothetical protein
MGKAKKKARGSRLHIRLLLAVLVLGPMLYRNLPAMIEFAKIGSAKSATKDLIAMVGEGKSDVKGAIRDAAKTCAGADVPAQVTVFLADMVETKMREQASLKTAEEQGRNVRRLAEDQHEKFKQDSVAAFEKLYAQLSPADQKKAEAAVEAMGRGKWYETGGLCIIKTAVQKLKSGREAPPES